VLARTLVQCNDDWEVIGLDNLIRRGSEQNLAVLREHGIAFVHADVRSQSDLDALPSVDAVIDASANASVLAGSDGQSSSRQLMEHNLFGTVNLLEKCKRDNAAFVMLSTSRVYSISHLREIPLLESDARYVLDANASCQDGVEANGVNEQFSTRAPLSLYGASKLASEVLALEYGELGQFPVWINRCGLLAGAGQFGRPDQGILSFWIHSHFHQQPMRYIGFDGSGFQTRDCLHPRDLAVLVQKQLACPFDNGFPQIVNVSGGPSSAISLRQLTRWCDNRFGPHEIGQDLASRQFDIPWLVLDPTLAQTTWDWQPEITASDIFEEIADHAEQNPDWLEASR